MVWTKIEVKVRYVEEKENEIVISKFDEEEKEKPEDESERQQSKELVREY